MDKLDDLFSRINNGNKQAIQDFVVSSRQYVLNTARCFVNDDKQAIDIAKKVYEKIIFTENKFDKNEISKYLYSLVKEETKNYSTDKLELVDLDKISSDVSVIDIDDSKYSKYYNDPKVERVFYDTINSLPKEEKEIVIRHYFGQESIEDIASSFNVSEDIVNKYINNANSLIESASKPLFVKYKIETADYSKVAIIYSTVKKCISILNLDVLDLAADKVKDAVAKDDEEDEKDLKAFVKDILEDLVQDWFLGRLKTVFAFSAVGGTSAAFVNTAEEATKDVLIKGVAKKASASVAKKVIIGALTAGVAVTGGVVVNNIIETKKEAQIVDNAVSFINAQMTFASTPVFIDFCSTKNDNEVDKLRAEFSVNKESINESGLKAIELTASAIGVNISHSESSSSYTIVIIADKNDLGNKLIGLASSLNILSEDEINEIKNMMNYNVDELTDYLYDNGYVRLLVD